MNTLLKAVALSGALLASSILPALSGDLTPTGKWKTSTGESQYSVTMCGDGTELCAKLVWLSDKAQTDDNLALLNGYVVEQAKMTGENQWKGTFRFDGQSGTGKLTMVSADRMTLSGCKLGICKDFEFVRI